MTSIVAVTAAALLVHATAAGAAITPAITDVARSDLLIPGSDQRCIRVAWIGDQTPARMGARETLNSRMTGERFQIRAIWVVSDLGTVLGANRDADVAALRDELYTRLLGDCQLGGVCADLDVGDATTSWLEWTGSVGRALDIEVEVDYSEFTRAA